ncbi:unnamed protein product [Gongylonema pulchrum]|uniref:Uncharacterized protein n=1 Tax=Gongylonema pulchrum TaxID=637853 RepID=A0A3P6Q6Q7_9BILA|nr:unnamed protein product [Gongylonema pulchrum]
MQLSQAMTSPAVSSFCVYLHPISIRMWRYLPHILIIWQSTGLRFRIPICFISIPSFGNRNFGMFIKQLWRLMDIAAYVVKCSGKMRICRKMTLPYCEMK